MLYAQRHTRLRDEDCGLSSEKDVEDAAQRHVGLTACDGRCTAVATCNVIVA